MSSSSQQWPFQPGVHSHNHRRTLPQAAHSGTPAVRIARLLLFLVGICGIGYYGYSAADELVYQNYENWTFDQQIAGGTAVSFADYLRAKTGLAEPAGTIVEERVAESKTAPKMEIGQTLGRVEVPRLHLAAIVREGVDTGTLQTAVGHVPSTALPGQRGNVAIAAHRDTLFRGLKDVRAGDVVALETSDATYNYRVTGTKIVKPSDVSVLRSDPDTRELTMITCYPFYYVGAAPNRFIVEAKLISTKPNS